LENGGAADSKGTEMITPYFPRTQTGFVDSSQKNETKSLCAEIRE
jgi:hypothetical protein